MSELLTINNIGTSGIATDPQPWQLPPENITNGKNFRIFAGAIESAGGQLAWNSDAGISNSGHLQHVTTPAGDFWLIMNRGTVYAFDGSTFSNISSVAGYTGISANDELLWTSCMLGKIPILNNPQVHPEYWDPQTGGTVLQPLQFDASNTFAAMGFQFNVIRSHKNILFALNLIEASVEYPSAYRWSHPADINGLPFSWDPSDNSALAGRAQLGGDSGILLDGQSLRDAFCLYSENAINVLDYTGDEFVFNRRNLSETIGIVATDCVIEVKGNHFFIGDGDILINNGTKIDSIIHNKLRRRFIRNANSSFYSRSFIVRNTALKEIWFCVPEDTSEYPNVTYVYNWKDNSWAIRDLPAGLAYAGYGSQVDPPVTWDTMTENWDTINSSWNFRSSSQADKTVIGVNASDGALSLLDPSNPDSNVNVLLERTDFPLLGHRQVTTITRVYPKISGSQAIQIEIGSQDYAGAPVRWKPAVTFTPGVDRKVDIRTTGELHCWRFSSEGTGPWLLSGMEIEYELGGFR